MRSGPSTIGGDYALNEGSTIQGHSMEDVTFKSGHIVLGIRHSQRLGP